MKLKFFFKSANEKRHDNLKIKYLKSGLNVYVPVFFFVKNDRFSRDSRCRKFNY